jgi:trk system potassium uptake protein TrkA
MRRQFVVGLGRLGLSMAGTLDSLGHEVLAIDKREEVTQELADYLPNVHLVAADATDEDAMRGLNIEGFDAAAVMMGENHVEACILATATLKEVGIPTIVARATGGIHARVLPGQVPTRRARRPVGGFPHCTR